MISGSPIVALIWLYRTFFRSRLKRECLFEVSCSEYALRAANIGFRSGLRAIFHRWCLCRDGIVAAHDERQGWGILGRYGQRASASELKQPVRQELYESVASAQKASSHGLDSQRKSDTYLGLR